MTNNQDAAATAGFIVGATLAECINQMPEEAREPAASADRVKDPEPRGSSLEGTRLGAAERGMEIGVSSPDIEG
jgi:hypothetical protein